MAPETRSFQGTLSLRPLSFNHPLEVSAALQAVGVDPYGLEAMAPKMIHHNLLLEGVACKVANIIKQEMLSLGGDAAVTRDAVSCCVATTDVLLMGTEKQLLHFADKISRQPFGLGEVSRQVREIISHLAKRSFSLKTARREMTVGPRTLIMGILNVTPDSFSDGGRYEGAEAAIAAGERMAAEGADLIDIGGESSRPGADPVPEAEELRRVIPVIKGLAERITLPISIDTMKARVAREAVAAGAEIINDISAMHYDRTMPDVVAETGAAIVLMHMRGKPKTMQTGDLSYRSLMGEICNHLSQAIEAVEKAGASRLQTLIDPGIGFGKQPSDNLRLIRHLPEMKGLGRPIVIGASRKSFIGHVLGGGVADRLEGTAAAVTAAILNGGQIVRVHDVAVMKRVATMADALAGVEA